MALIKNEVYQQKELDPAILIIKNLNRQRQIKVKKIDSVTVDFNATLEKKGSEFRFSSDKVISKLRFTKMKDFRKIIATWNGSDFVLGRIFSNNLLFGSFEGECNELSSIQFSGKRKLFQRLIIPLKAKISFYFFIEHRYFETKTSNSIECVRANFKNCFLETFLFTDHEKNNFLVVDSSAKISHDEFSDKAFSVLVALGYLTGKLVQGEGVYFSYTNKKMENPMAFNFSSFRPSINSIFHPVNANPFAFKVNAKRGDYLLKNMRTITEEEFSILCQQVNDKVDLRSGLLMMMEALKGSIFTMATGMAVILEVLTNLFAKEHPEYLTIIKQPKISSVVLKELRTVINSHKDEIGDLTDKLINKINQINQIPNKVKLTKPFEILGFKLNKNDENVIERRNDLLHGRLSLEYGAENDMADRELYLIATKLYTLINVLILKQVGFDNYIVNWPVHNKHVHKKKLSEEVFRKI